MTANVRCKLSPIRRQSRSSSIAAGPTAEPPAKRGRRFSTRSRPRSEKRRPAAPAGQRHGRAAPPPPRREGRSPRRRPSAAARPPPRRAARAPPVPPAAAARGCKGRAASRVAAPPRRARPGSARVPPPPAAVPDGEARVRPPRVRRPAQPGRPARSGRRSRRARRARAGSARTPPPRPPVLRRCEARSSSPPPAARAGGPHRRRARRFRSGALCGRAGRSGRARAGPERREAPPARRAVRARAAAAWRGAGRRRARGGRRRVHRAGRARARRPRARPERPRRRRAEAEAGSRRARRARRRRSRSGRGSRAGGQSGRRRAGPRARRPRGDGRAPSAERRPPRPGDDVGSRRLYERRLAPGEGEVLRPEGDLDEQPEQAEDDEQVDQASARPQPENAAPVRTEEDAHRGREHERLRHLDAERRRHSPPPQARQPVRLRQRVREQEERRGADEQDDERRPDDVQQEQDDGEDGADEADEDEEDAAARHRSDGELLQAQARLGRVDAAGEEAAREGVRDLDQPPGDGQARIRRYGGEGDPGQRVLKRVAALQRLVRHQHRARAEEDEYKQGVGDSERHQPQLAHALLPGQLRGGEDRASDQVERRVECVLDEAAEPVVDRGLDPAFWDIPGRIKAAIDDWFRGLVEDALTPALDLIGRTILSTPQLAGQERVGELWLMSLGIADALLVLVLLCAGAVLMTHETLQSRYALKDALPRIAFAAVAANASLAVSGQLIEVANALSGGFLSGGVDPAEASLRLKQFAVAAVASGGIFLVLVGLVCAVFAVILLLLYIVRAALVVLLVCAAPLFLLAHALPQTDGLARLWWRGMAAALGVQVAQAFVLATAVRVFFSPDGRGVLGLGASGSLIDLLVVLCLLWLLVKIPFWAKDLAFSGRQPALVQAARTYVVARAGRAALS